MAVLDWLQQLLGGGDPEAQGAAAASTAMMPAVNQWAQNVASGQYVRQGLPSNYDPQRSFAQNALDPGSLENALNVALGVGGGSGLGIKAYHGSPADFSAEPGYPLGRFRDDKIGTGEGAQAYAYGHYGAEAEPVARGYRDQISLGQVRIPGSEANLAEHDVLGQAARHLYNANGDYDLAAQRIRQLVPDAKQPQTLQSLGELQKLGAAPHAGKMYEVDINAEPEHFLDWDKPATAQPPNVQDALGKIWQQLGGTTEGRQYPPFAAHSETTGEGLHAALATTLGSKEAAAAALRDAGVPGVRYLDQGSRGAGQGTSNYVVFDPKIIEILRKYGIIPPAVGAGLLGAADQQ